MLEQSLRESKAKWQIVVTHFPCGEDGEGGRWYRSLHQEYGVDLLVTGHRHDQELWLPTMRKNKMGGLTCIVTGGGGGITSEATPDSTNTVDWYGEGQYGFFDLTITHTHIMVEAKQELHILDCAVQCCGCANKSDCASELSSPL